MCGFVAGYAKSGRELFDKATTQAALHNILHRGPDAQGIWVSGDGNVFLGHSRLSIIDTTAAGDQPFKSADGRYIVVFNGEIYNFEDLKEDLIQKGCKFTSKTDTEVLLYSFIEYGPRMLARLNGIFAFAVYDALNGELFVARDAFGVKPFYFANLGSGYVCSSELKALLPFLASDKEIDFKALAQYMTFIWSPGNRTALSSVKKLGPAEAAIIKDGEVVEQWNWTKLPLSAHAGYANDFDKCKEGTLSHLRTAVQRQMIADVPVGAFLSGGLDSSAIVALAKQSNPDIQCYTIEISGSEDPGIVSDLGYAKKVARHLDVNLSIVKVDAQLFLSHLEDMIWALDEPIADPAALNVLFICRQARQLGHKVLLSGAGGDDVFSGYRRHRALHIQKYLDLCPKTILIGFEKAASLLKKSSSISRKAGKFFDGVSLRGDDRIVNFFSWINYTKLKELMTDEFKEAVNGFHPHRELTSFLEDLPPSLERIDRCLALEQRFFLADHNLLYTDKMSMFAGIEVRVPFLDPDLVSFAARIPTKFKQKGLEGKFILKEAFEGILPKDVIYRPKTGFGLPIRNWVKNDLNDEIMQYLSPEVLRKRGLFEPSAVQSLLQSNQAGAADNSYAILSLVCIEIWCRKFLD
ncbi:MAG: asparagine synthase (glutamine-hydrolyzing) [Paracoccaceae bacterium]